MLLPTFLFFLAAQAGADFTLDGPPAEWLIDNAPHGMDVTLDGKIWINLNPVGNSDDFAVLGNDLYRVKHKLERRPTVWLRGYHLRNKQVAYRETKLLVFFDCDRRMIRMEKEVQYDAGGRAINNLGAGAMDYIIPGSRGDGWAKVICS